MPLPAALLKGAQAIMKFGKSAKAASEFVTQLGGDILELGNKADRTAKKIIHSADLISKRWVLMQDTAFKTARTMAMSREEALRYNESLIKSTKDLAAQYGVTAKELANFQESYAKATGRNVVLTKEQLAHTSALSKIAGEDASRLIDEFDKVGVGIAGATANIGRMQERAKALGVSPAKATKMMADNIKLAASYSFKNGVADIEKMSLKAASMRMDMQSIMNATEKFANIEGAISTSANIQMLGGSFAREFSNPMGAMYEAMADPAAFQERILRTIQGKGEYNAETGEVKFDPITMRMMREVATQLGMSAEQLNVSAMASVQNEKVMEQFAKNAGKAGFNDKDKEAIKNLARGNFDEETKQYKVNWIDENGNVQSKAVEELTKEELQLAKDQKWGEEELWGNVRDIKTILERVHGRARETKSVKEAEEGIESWWDAQITNIQDIWMRPISDFYNGVSNWLGKQLFSGGGVVKPLHAAVGAIVPGTSYYGDRVPAMLNSGEMVLNQNQQKSMFNLISSLALNGGMMYGVNKLGGKVGAKGLGSTMLMANMIGGGDAGIKEYIEAHFLQKFIKNINPFKKSIEEVGKASKTATVSTSTFTSSLLDIGKKWGTVFNNWTYKIGKLLAKPFVSITNGLNNLALVKELKGLSGIIKNTNYYANARGSKFGVKTETGANRWLGKADSDKLGKWTKKAIKAKAYKNEFIKDVKGLFKTEGTAKAAEAATKEISNVTKAAGSGGKILSGLGKAGKIVGKKIPYIGTALAVGGAVSGMMGASSQYDAQIDKINSSNMSELDKARAKDRATKQKNAGIGGSIGSAAGSLGGMAAGAATGAAIGSVIPVVGTAIGGILGGAIGAFGGEKLGGLFGKGIGSLFGGNEEKKVKEKEEKILGIDEGSIKNREDLVKYVKSIDSKIGIKHSIGLTPLSLPRINPITDIMTSAVRSLPIVGNFMRVLPSVRENGQSGIQPIGKTDINLNVSGTIKLDGGGKTADLDISKLLDTPEFKRQLADIITRRINENSNGGKRNMESERNNMASQYNKSGS